MKNEEIETRGDLMCLIDWRELYGEQKSAHDAIELIKSLPSLSILTIIAAINRELYLQDRGTIGQQTQIKMLKGLLTRQSLFSIRIIEVFTERIKERYVAFFYRYSNLLFYELILENYNNQPIRELTPVECEHIVKAYFIINGLANERIKVKDLEIDQAFEEDKIEDILLPHFIYQRDYISNTDYSNQVTRGYYFFKYLDEHPTFSPYVIQYYRRINISHRCELLIKFIPAFSLLLHNNKTIITLVGDISEPYNQFLVGMSMDPNSYVSQKDDSFSQFRSKMFLRLPNDKLMLLDIGFFIDQLYKAHVFGFNALMKESSFNNFLSVKGKEFMEEIYLPLIMEHCFPDATCLAGKMVPNSKGNDLADYMVKNSGKLLLIEFKDILLSAVAKNSGSKKELFKAMNEKLLKNERTAPKGIEQLVAGISELVAHHERFSSLLTGHSDTIYPVLIYTDNVLGFEGVNKKYSIEFRKLMGSILVKNYTVKDVVFINLSFFELYEDLLKAGQLDIFTLIDDYLIHVAEPNTSLVPFEVFATAYRKGNVNQSWEPTSFYKETCEQVNKEFLLLK